MTERPSDRVLPSTSVALSPDLKFALQAQIQVAMVEIDQVHFLRKHVQINVAQNTKRTEEGSYDPQRLRIEISGHAVDPPGTFIHEYGHFVDNRILHPLSKEYASRYDLEMSRLMGLLMKSRPVLEMLSLLRHKRLSRRDQYYLRYVTQPQEVFARAYAQWICSKSLNFVLQSSMNRRISIGVRAAGRLLQLQWESEEFADIMVELENVFHVKGLI